METKHCSRCNQDKSIEDFRWKDKEKGWRQPYCIPCNIAYNKEHYQNNKKAYADKARAYELSRGGKRMLIYKLDEASYQKLFNKFDGKCWACKTKPGYAIDHDHKCCPDRYKTCGNCIRGILCRECNAGIGLLGDDVTGLENAVAYLKNFYN